MIVSQGQIDAVLNARPEERRSIIEEAAGVLKFRRRKEKAERRLDATEANLLRVQDLLREVRRQLRPLERQAEAARRHGDLVAELSALQIFLAGREIASLRTRLTALAGEKLSLQSAEQELRAELAGLDTDVMAAEAELTARGDLDLSDEMVRVEQLRERARGIAAVLVERRRSMERDRGQLMDSGVVANLEADADNLARRDATARRRARPARARGRAAGDGRSRVRRRTRQSAVDGRSGRHHLGGERRRRSARRASLAARRCRSSRSASWNGSAPGTRCFAIESVASMPTRRASDSSANTHRSSRRVWSPISRPPRPGA